MKTHPPHGRAAAPEVEPTAPASPAAPRGGHPVRLGPLLAAAGGGAHPEDGAALVRGPRARIRGGVATESLGRADAREDASEDQGVFPPVRAETAPDRPAVSSNGGGGAAAGPVGRLPGGAGGRVGLFGRG